MVGDPPRTGSFRALHALVMVVAVAASLQPSLAFAAPAGQDPPDVAAFDRGFRGGQEEFNQQRYLSAARVWTGAAGELPEADEHKENRRAIYEYIAQAYEKAVTGGANDDVVQEGLAVLDAYADVYVAAHPTETLPEQITKARLAFRARLGEREATPQSRPAAVAVPAAVPVTVPEAAAPPAKPWKGLAIGGGVAVAGGAAMLGMFAAGFMGAKAAQSRFDDSANGCTVDNVVGTCAAIQRDGKTANTVAVVGLVAAPLLVGAGIAMLVVGLRRKPPRTALAPMLGPGVAGLVWQQRF